MRQNIEGVYGEIDSLPGCTQIVVSHSVFTPENSRGTGRGRRANETRQYIAFEELGYDMMLCTVDAANETQKAILDRTGWTFLTVFSSRKTGHNVELWCVKRDG